MRPPADLTDLTDPPGHTKLRKIMPGSFTQLAVAVYEHFVAGLTEEVPDDGLRAGELGFADAAAKEVPIRVLARNHGPADADLDQFIDLGDRLIASTDPASPPPGRASPAGPGRP